MASDSETTSPSFDGILADCLAQLEREGDRALESFCRAHPQHATELRERVALLRDAGLLETPAAADGLPQAFGPYRPERRLGAGGMGIVYLARHEDSGACVALKVMRPELLLFGPSRQRFAREIESTRRLQHDGIVAIRDVGETEGVPYFAMDFVDGASVADILASVRHRAVRELEGRDFLAAFVDVATAELPPAFSGSWSAACFDIVRQAAVAVHHAHENGVLHRDLKPSNIMLTRSGRVVLLDFGLAAIEGDSQLTRTGTRLGSLDYMSPEQLQGDRARVDRRTDVYSLAVTLYEMLTLRAPFAGDSEETIRSRILDGRPASLRSLNPSVSRDGETVCLKAMDTDARYRYVSAAAFAADLGNVLVDRSILARRPSVVLRVRKWARRNPARASAVALAGLLLFGGPLAFAWMQHERAVSIGEEQKATEASLKLTFKALEKMGTRLAEQELRHVPHAAELRRKILEDTLKLYRELLVERPDDTRVWELTAMAEGRLSEVLLRLGRFAVAREALSRADDLYGQLLDRFPRRTDLRFRRLGEQHRNIAIEIVQGKLDRAETAAVALRADLDALLTEHPADLYGRSLQAQVTGNLAVVYRRTKRKEAGAKLAARVVELYQKLVEDDPSSLHREQLARAYSAHMVHLSAFDHGRVIEIGSLAVSLYEELLSGAPGNADYRFGLGKIHNVRATSRKAQRDFDGAIAEYQKSLELRRGLVADFPHVPVYWSDAGGSLSNLASVYNSRKEPDPAAQHARDALRHQRRALALAPDHDTFKRYLVIQYRELSRALMTGKHHEALHAILTERAEASLDRGYGYWASAIAEAGLIGLCGNDPDLSEGRRSELRATYECATVVYLRRALELGCKQVNLDDKRLAMLRARSDFRALRREPVRRK